MKPRRNLALRREGLTDLYADDLRSVAGGTHIATDCGCITHGYSCDDCRIPTLPINDCIDKLTPTIQIRVTRDCAS